MFLTSCIYLDTQAFTYKCLFGASIMLICNIISLRKNSSYIFISNDQLDHAHEMKNEVGK